MIKHLAVPWHSIALCLAALVASTSPAVADGVTITSWSPFPYFYCSSCGPNTPLTLEQADGAETFVGTGITQSELSLPVVRSNSLTGAGDTPAPSVVAAKPGVTLSVSSFSSHQLGHGTFKPDGDDDRDGVEEGEGLEYNVNVSTDHTGHGDDDAAFDDDRDQNEGDKQGTTTFTSDDLDSSGDNAVSGGESGESLAPEPTSLILLGSGLALLASRVRRRKAA